MASTTSSVRLSWMRSRRELLPVQPQCVGLGWPPPQSIQSRYQGALASSHSSGGVRTLDRKRI